MINTGLKARCSLMISGDEREMVSELLLLKGKPEKAQLGIQT